jgi:hypothetical protein
MDLIYVQRCLSIVTAGGKWVWPSGEPEDWEET